MMETPGREKGGGEEMANVGKSEKNTQSIDKKSDEKTERDKKRGWVRVSEMLDVTHRTLRGHEILLLTSLCLCCTVLCVFVTNRHLKLEDKVRNIQIELDLLGDKGRWSGEERLMTRNYLANQNLAQVNKGKRSVEENEGRRSSGEEKGEGGKSAAEKDGGRISMVKEEELARKD